MQYHPQLSDGEKEEICQLIDVQRLSRDLCRDVAQNENLPIRVIVKALFCEMLDLKKSLADHEDGNDTGTEVENTEEDGTDSTKGKILSESKGAFSRLRFWKRGGWIRLTSSKPESPKEMEETENAGGAKVMCRSWMNMKTLSVEKFKALLAPTKQ